jgi:hypothetical protein
MKTVVNSAPKNEIKFPCLMRSKSGMIALFNSPTSGIVLDVGKTNSDLAGYYDPKWHPIDWTPLLPGESVTLIQE